MGGSLLDEDVSLVLHSPAILDEVAVTNEPRSLLPTALFLCLPGSPEEDGFTPIGEDVGFKTGTVVITVESTILGSGTSVLGGISKGMCSPEWSSSDIVELKLN